VKKSIFQLSVALASILLPAAAFALSVQSGIGSPQRAELAQRLMERKPSLLTAGTLSALATTPSGAIR